jgi:hypothetical protein
LKQRPLVYQNGGDPRQCLAPRTPGTAGTTGRERARRRARYDEAPPDRPPMGAPAGRTKRRDHETAPPSDPARWPRLSSSRRGLRDGPRRPSPSTRAPAGGDFSANLASAREAVAEPGAGDHFPALPECFLRATRSASGSQGPARSRTPGCRASSAPSAHDMVILVDFCRGRTASTTPSWSSGGRLLGPTTRSPHRRGSGKRASRRGVR